MSRLLRYLPIVFPMILRFFRSPRGKALIAKITKRGGPAQPGR